MTKNASAFTYLLRRSGRMGLVALLVALTGVTSYTPGNAQSAAVVRVVGPTAPVPAGQPFIVTIAMENAQDLGAFEFEYNFSPAVASATVNDIQLGSLLGSSGRTSGVLRMASAPGQPGVPLFGAYSYGTAAGPTGNGILATVTMHAVAAGVSQLSLSNLTITNVAGEEFSAMTTAGSVTVTGAARLLYLPLLRRSN